MRICNNITVSYRGSVATFLTFFPGPKMVLQKDPNWPVFCLYSCLVGGPRCRPPSSSPPSSWGQPAGSCASTCPWPAPSSSTTNLQSWARVIFFSFATTTTRQRNRASGTRENSKYVKVSVSKWSSHNEYCNNAVTNNCVAWKHGHIVATVLLRAQLWEFIRV